MALLGACSCYHQALRGEQQRRQRGAASSPRLHALRHHITPSCIVFDAELQVQLQVEATVGGRGVRWLPRMTGSGGGGGGGAGSESGAGVGGDGGGGGGGGSASDDDDRSDDSSGVAG
jgi:hypothetical protein